MILWIAAALASPAWSPIGPERGHVVDASIGENRVVVATRVGVMTAASPSDIWERDPRYPEGTRRVAVWQEGAWAGPPGQLWEVGEESTRLVHSFTGGIAVDLVTTDEGRVFAAVRGPSGGAVWRADPGGTAERVLTDIDPWTLCTRGDEVWLGTVDRGLWVSRDGGEQFESVEEGGVSALGLVDGELWAGFSDGRILNVDEDEEQLRIQGGHASSIAGMGPDRALVTVISPMGQAGPLQQIDGSSIRPIQKLKVDEDVGYLGPTGAWALQNGEVLVGTFRRGPLLWDGSQLRLARTNFQAFVSGGAAIDAQGRLLMAGMGTGVYVWQDGEFGAHLAGQGPVTDTVAVKRIGDQVSVVDFEGIVTLGANGQWTREEGVQDIQRSQRNGLVDVGRDDQGTLWGIDGDGRLHKREADQWRRCKVQQALRLDGDGPHLVVATKQGFLQPNCDQAISAFDFDAPADQSRALGGWVAVPSKLYGGGRLKSSLPSGEIQALSVGEKGLLVAIAGQPVLHCTPECEAITAPPPSEIDALGWLPDGRVWAMEKKGSVLIAEEGAHDPGPWTTVVATGKGEWSLSTLLKDPWMSHGPGKGPPPRGKQEAKPPPLSGPVGGPPARARRFRLLTILAFLAIPVGFILLRKRSR